jgi:tRNA-uridine 2-sulfurtransferase
MEAAIRNYTTLKCGILLSGIILYMPKVLVGMSGGVDSSVTAYLLKEQGYEVEGLSFILWEARNRSGPAACCSREAFDGASMTAGQLGIRHEAVDVRGEFIDKVVAPFAEEYRMGMTPNPCILCNKYIKFPFLLREAVKRGAGYIATGHYARIVKGSSSESGKVHLLQEGIDPKKDQSYVLYMLDQETLGKLIFPLGDYRKDEVRAIARSLSLAAADRPESQEICFIEDRNYSGFIEKLMPVSGEPGPVIDMNGKVVGTHKGVYCYTIGQRKGLGISSLQPHYVTKIDVANNAVYVGSRKDVNIRSFSVSGLHWIISPGESSFRARVKVRSMMEAKPARVEMGNGEVNVTFDEPQWAPAPGQSAVFYNGCSVMGGGIIASEA